MPSPSSKRKNYVLDTSVLAYHGESIHSFEGHNVYIPLEVLEELDNLKVRMDTVGGNCRYVNKYLDGLREQGSLVKGVKVDGKQTIFVANFSDIGLLSGNFPDTNDNRIISVAAKLIKDGQKAVVVSRDISLRVRCDTLGIPAESFSKGGLRDHDIFYDGLITVDADIDMVDEFYANGELHLSEDDFFPKLYPNQGVVLKSGKKSALAIACDNNVVKKLKYAGDRDIKVEGIIPRSKEQVIALELLLDPAIQMVSISGMAGSGKTLLAIASAMSMIHTKKYKKLVIARPAQSTSKDIGFLPGTKEEKVRPWLQPIFDNLSVITAGKGMDYIDRMIEKGIIELESLAYVRGRTLPDCIFIVDEAQNITHHEAKALLTRMGDNSKIILLGDLEQIDSPSVDQKSSGLASVVELFKEFPHSGHIRLIKGERSALATYAAKVM